MTKYKKGTLTDRQILVKGSIVIKVGAIMKEDIQNQHISQRTEVLIRLLLLGRFNLTEVAMITGISEQLLEDYLSTKCIDEYQQVRF